MYFTDTLRGLWRRWYIVVPGLLIAASLAIGAWNLIPPGYERSSTQLLIPGAESMPVGANPYLFLGGLVPAADVIVRAVGSANLLDEVVADNPGVKVEVSRDTTTAGPVILIVVTAPTDAAAQKVQGLLVERTAMVLDDIQSKEGIAAQNRMTVLPVTIDNRSVLQERNRFIAVGTVGFVGLALTLLLAGLVEGFSRNRKRDGDNAANDDGHPTATPDAANVTSPSSKLLTPTPTRAPVPSGPSAGSSGPFTTRDQSHEDTEQDVAASTLSHPR
ncbi:hypothetical protein JF66_02560 [Cryobacterium sp. MLB-32]|uniref:hypothetical protein n=1 Tax=Cryobacterium sp. MLB-32 TaxID=1529318 RepID=UPI0004E7A44A|nr:hypothetical protein [Cryobacterium sp. MLB-32]KFF60733.1 hypothetical protein JF66_02560 [Cryobacterium sp. MLB-32]